MPYITAILAMNNDCLIGKTGGLPWNIPEDMKHFRLLTQNSVVIMGKNTFFSLPENFRPLPNRRNIILTNSSIEGLECFSDINVMLDMLSKEGILKIFIIGGAQIYDTFFDQGLINRVELTVVDGVHEGNIYIKDFRNDFREIKKEEHEDFSFITLEKI